MGDAVGPLVGPAVGPTVGPSVGIAVGTRVGETVGPAVGPAVGSVVGAAVGAKGSSPATSRTRATTQPLWHVSAGSSASEPRRRRRAPMAAGQPVAGVFAQVAELLRQSLMKWRPRCAHSSPSQGLSSELASVTA